MHQYIQLSASLYEDSGGPDQTTYTQADLGFRCAHISPKSTFHMARITYISDVGLARISVLFYILYGTRV